jgi:hypothetical protein
MPLPNDQVSEWVTNLKKIRELCGKYNPDATKGGLNDFAKKKLSELLQGAALVNFGIDVKKEFPGTTISISDAYTFAQLTDYVSSTSLFDSVWALVRATCDASCLKNGDLNPTKSVRDGYPSTNDAGWAALKDGVHKAGLDESIENKPANVNTELEKRRSATPSKPLSELLTYLSTMH